MNALHVKAMIDTPEALSAFCQQLRGQPFITIDTEFLRDKTYYSQLCLVQVAASGIDAVAIDPLKPGMDLAPLLAILDDPAILKVFHAARQDIEIFYHLTGKIPAPLFDTQVAASVCGYGDQVGYYNLVQAICGASLDKGSQFTDWARRPLSDRQMFYALDDVTYLRDVYKHLVAELELRGRTEWVREEMAILMDPATYENVPDAAWERIKIRSDKPKVLAVLRAVASWREHEAQRRDIPRQRVIKDETLAEIALNMPANEIELGQVRNIGADMARGRTGQALLAAIAEGLAAPRDHGLTKERRRAVPADLTPVLEMLKMLLRIQCAEHGVAAKLVASADDLEALALDDAAEIPAQHGWRLEVFGRAALAMKRGHLSLALKNNVIKKIQLSDA